MGQYGLPEGDEGIESSPDENCRHWDHREEMGCQDEEEEAYDEGVPEEEVRMILDSHFDLLMQEK